MQIQYIYIYIYIYIFEVDTDVEFVSDSSVDVLTSELALFNLPAASRRAATISNQTQ